MSDGKGAGQPAPKPRLEVTASSLRVVDEGDWGLSVERYIAHTYPHVEETVENTVLIFPSEIDGLIEALQAMRERKRA